MTLAEHYAIVKKAGDEFLAAGYYEGDVKTPEAHRKTAVACHLHAVALKELMKAIAEMDERL
jgi:hypothetical protein